MAKKPQRTSAISRESVEKSQNQKANKGKNQGGGKKKKK